MDKIYYRNGVRLDKNFIHDITQLHWVKWQLEGRRGTET